MVNTTNTRGRAWWLRLFRSPYDTTPQPRLFDLEALREVGWLKVLRLEGYTFRRPGPP